MEPTIVLPHTEHNSNGIGIKFVAGDVIRRGNFGMDRIPTLNEFYNLFLTLYFHPDLHEQMINKPEYIFSYSDLVDICIVDSDITLNEAFRVFNQLKRTPKFNVHLADEFNMNIVSLSNSTTPTQSALLMLKDMFPEHDTDYLSSMWDQHEHDLDTVIAELVNPTQFTRGDSELARTLSMELEKEEEKRIEDDMRLATELAADASSLSNNIHLFDEDSIQIMKDRELATSIHLQQKNRNRNIKIQNKPDFFPILGGR